MREIAAFRRHLDGVFEPVNDGRDNPERRRRLNGGGQDGARIEKKRLTHLDGDAAHWFAVGSHVEEHFRQTHFVCRRNFLGRIRRTNGSG